MERPESMPSLVVPFGERNFSSDGACCSSRLARPRLAAFAPNRRSRYEAWERRGPWGSFDKLHRFRRRKVVLFVLEGKRGGVGRDPAAQPPRALLLQGGLVRDASIRLREVGAGFVYLVTDVAERLARDLFQLGTRRDFGTHRDILVIWYACPCGGSSKQGKAPRGSGSEPSADLGATTRRGDQC